MNAQPGTQTAQAAGSALSVTTSSGLLGRTGLNGTNARVRDRELRSRRVGATFSSSGWNTTDNFDQSDDYISFTVAPLAGFALTLTDLQYVISGSARAPGTGLWGYGINGGAFTLQPTFAIPGRGTDLVTWDFADFTTTFSVEFRFWAYGATSVNGRSSFSTGVVRVANRSGDDLILNGSTTLARAAVPEHGGMSLITIAVLAILAFGAFAGRAVKVGSD